MELCKVTGLSYARIPLIWNLAQFKKFDIELREAVAQLIDDESIKLAILNPIEKLKMIELIPKLKQLASASEDDLYAREAQKTKERLELC